MNQSNNFKDRLSSNNSGEKILFDILPRQSLSHWYFQYTSLKGKNP